MKGWLPSIFGVLFVVLAVALTGVLDTAMQSARAAGRGVARAELAEPVASALRMGGVVWKREGLEVFLVQIDSTSCLAVTSYTSPAKRDYVTLLSTAAVPCPDWRAPR